MSTLFPAPKAAYSAEFERAYQLWPKKSEKWAAWLEWKRLLNGNEAKLAPVLIAALEWQAPIYANRDAKRFIPDFRRWIHNRGFEEEAVDGVTKGDKSFGDPALCPDCGRPWKRHLGFKNPKTGKDCPL